ncbi:MAG: hypothetical protein JNJ82_15365 [Opitutaceae bacterium]|nr:hypothetical protein [Opitutaceae bacterium]
MKKGKQAFLPPRFDFEMIAGGEAARGTAAERRRRVEEAIDRFAADASAESVAECHKKVVCSLRERGWIIGVDGAPQRDGVGLVSEEGRNLDRIAFALWDFDIRRSKLALRLRGVPERIRRQVMETAMYAFEAGCAAAEFVVFRDKVKGIGRKPGKEKKRAQMDAIGRAVEKWRRLNPRETRQPKAEEIMDLYIQPSADDRGGAGHFRNLVTEYWKIHGK